MLSRNFDGKHQLFQGISWFIYLYIFPKEMNKNVTQIILGQGLSVSTFMSFLDKLNRIKIENIKMYVRMLL